MSNASRTRTPQDTAGTQESRAKALQSAITAIEKAFGKGAIMRLGDNHGMAVERIPTSRSVAACRSAASPKSTAPSRPARPPSPCRSLPAPSAPGCNAPLSMQSTRSIRVTRSSWASISANSSSPSPTPASRRWKSVTRWCALAPSAWWWSIPSLPWCRKTSWKARSATPRWVSRPA